jgi:TetR/AcrR family transcriptional regulator, cholesterol catabolism regulator
VTKHSFGTTAQKVAAEQTPGVRDAQKLATRERVIDAARAMFEQLGYEQATVRDIAARAGVAVGSVFTTFTAKSDVLEEIAWREFARHGAIATMAAQRDDLTLADAIRHWASDAYALDTQSPRLAASIYAAMWTWGDRAERESRKHLSTQARALEAIFERAIMRGEIADLESPQMLARLVRETYVQGVRDGVQEGVEPELLAQRMHRFVSMLVGGLARTSATASR